MTSRKRSASNKEEEDGVMVKLLRSSGMRDEVGLLSLLFASS